MLASKLSVLIKAEADAEMLARTLAALVPAIAEGVVGDGVIVCLKASAGMEAVADAAGCPVLVLDQPMQLATALAQLRGEFVLYLASGSVPEAGWWIEAEAFIRTAGDDAQAAFSPASNAWPMRGLLLQMRAAWAGLTGRRFAAEALIARRSRYIGNAPDDNFPPRHKGRVVLLSSRLFLSRR